MPPLGNSSALTRFTGESASKSTELMPFQLSSPERGAHAEERSPISLLSSVASAPNVTDREHYVSKATSAMDAGVHDVLRVRLGQC